MPERQSETNETPKMLTLTDLKARGWTDALVKQFLGEPDATKPNPHYRKAAPMRLYALARVEQAESQEEWQQAKARASRRSEASKKVSARKAAELVEQASQMRITVDRLPTETVIEQAIASYNAYNWEIAWRHGEAFEPATESSDPTFLDRITVNYIRHHLTSYDTHLEQLVGQIGVRQAGKVIRRRIYDAIAKAYPEYAQECERQMQARYGALSEQQEEA
ncbi:MAG: hypothetical protein JO202_09290 [Ktedonobacteraceae bacterium]|nr:hypothetical protein [Ktedonobacteraceae bacterium]